jgi:hypothetical protein
MKKTLAAGLVGLSLSFGLMAAAPALAQAPAALSTETTPIETLVANPAAKAVLEKNIPGISTHEAYDQFKAMTLTQVAPMSQGAVTDAIIKQVQADLDALPK